MALQINKRKGYISGILSGATWGLDAVMLGVVMVMAPFVENPILLAAGGIVCSALHDIFSAVWLLGIILWMDIISWASRCSTPSVPKENKNPYSVGQIKESKETENNA